MLQAVIWAPVWAHMEDWDHMSDHMSGWGWGMMGFFWLFSILVVALVVWAVWAGVRRASGHPTRRSGAVAVLEERFARGDISPEEYRERREVLEER